MANASMQKIKTIDRRDKSSYGEQYEDHLFEQYKLYVEMADRVSARRMLANSFFVSVHTALITAFVVLLKDGLLPKSLVGLAPFLAVLMLCFIWWNIISSYKNLNSAKFKLIGEVEGRLPISLFEEEWELLGKGQDGNKYKPLSHLENWVPICFAILYIALAYIFCISS